MRRHLLFLALAATPVLLPFFCSHVGASTTNPADSIPTLLSTDGAQPIEDASSGKVSSAGDNESLSPSALEVAKITGILPLYNRLRTEQQKAKSSTQITWKTPGGANHSPLAEGTPDHFSNKEQLLESLITRQRIIYLRTQIGQYLQTASLELSSVLGKLNSGMARLADTKAIIADERARILRRNSFINLISGGLTKIGGYSSALTPASLIPTNVLEVFDGGVQTSLSMLTLREQHNESKLYRSRPDILTSFISSQNEATREYPESVWTYLNQRDLSRKDNKTRRDVLIEYWLSTGRLSGATSKKSSFNQTAFAKNQINKMDDIDDNVAIMSDLKSAVSGMENSLMELSQVIKDSYKNDPEF